MVTPLIMPTDKGLYCQAGQFYIDPWKPVDEALITHAHSDHLKPGCMHYLATSRSVPLIHARIGTDISLQSIEYGSSLDIRGVKVSFHPAGHVLGSAQIRLENNGEIWVVSGDYKLEADPTCSPFESVKCDVFVTESTFGLPIYHWPDSEVSAREINDWWQGNRDNNLCSILYGYSLGKAQRLLATIDPSIGPIFVHGAVNRLNLAYRQAGIQLPPTRLISEAPPGHKWKGSMIVAPPSAIGTSWTNRFRPFSSGVASGWMTIRGNRRRRPVDRGFVLSDHADWNGLLKAIRQSEAQKVLVTHGYVAVLVRWLNENGIESYPLQTQYEGEIDDPTNEEVAE